MALGDTIARLSVSLSMNTSAFEKGARKSEGTLGRLKNFMIGPGGIAVAAAAVGAAMVKMSLDTFKTADEIYKASQSIGIGTEELSRLRYAADLSGVSFEQLTKGVGRLSRTMSDAQNGLAAPKRAFDALGISVTNTDGKLRSSTEIITEVADRFSRMEDGAKKTALAMEIFGRAGADMIPMLNQGQDGIAKLTEEASKFGFVIDEEAGRQAEEFNDNLARLEGASANLHRQLSMALLPTLLDITEGMVSATQSTSGFAKFFSQTMAIVRANVANTIPGLRILHGLLLSIRGPGESEPVASGFGSVAVAYRFATDALKQVQAGIGDVTDSFEPLGTAAEKAGGRAAGATRGISDAAREAQRQTEELQRVLDRLYPEEAAQRQNEAERQLLGLLKDRVQVERALLALALERSQVEWSRRDAEFRRLGEALDDGPLGKTGEATFQLGERLMDLSKKANVATVRIAKSVKDMADNMLNSINRITSAFKSGGLVGIIESLFALGLHLGEMGAFGKKVSGFLNRVPAYAGGTQFASGGLSLVGERGPELVNMPRGSQVIPNHQLGGGRVEIVLRDEMLDARIEGGAGVVLTRAYPAMRADTVAHVSQQRRRA